MMKIKTFNKILLSVTLIVAISAIGLAQENENPFKQLKEDLPTPNSYRTAAGAPGHEYWQQRADYSIKITLDDENQRIYGKETITYKNNSPDKLEYLWLQLDQNVRAQDAHGKSTKPATIGKSMTPAQVTRLNNDFEGGFNIDKVADLNKKDLSFTINQTMMRIDLDHNLLPGQSFSFNIKWWYNINNTREIRGRSGFENFEEDDNNVYVIAQFYPRMCLYNDVEGWQNKQFLGRGEFTLTFGDFDVELTVPADHLVAATGELVNPEKVLSKDQRNRWEQAKKEHIQPVMIATMEEAEERIQEKSTKTKTWKFSADNVRDFAFASSRRFLWDAMGVQMKDGRTVVAQSMWVKEGDCLWSRYSTKAVAHTIKWYSHYTIEYPYPVAWSIDGSMGMEYPMICFNFGRCEDDSTYSKSMKYGHIGVIIHEVGHNWFPMIINSDERQWTWMDEGMNSFVQYLTEQHWERNYPSRRGPANQITDYMKGEKDKISPIMTNSESIWQFGNNAYGKPATALNILRETIMGRELFDHAFKIYCNRWAFKHPSPADFFRTMEDASGVDLDWFWRGWFYTNEHCDLALESVRHFKIDHQNPDKKFSEKKAEQSKALKNISVIRNEIEIKKTLADYDSTIIDFYSLHNDEKVDEVDRSGYELYLESLSEDERKALMEGSNYYQMDFRRKGKLVMPIILELKFKDSTSQVVRIPAEIWRMGEMTVSKVFVFDQEIDEVILDPFLETADTDRSDNQYPPQQKTSEFKMNKPNQNKQENPMQKAKRAKELEKDRT